MTHILVVEDDPVQLELRQQILEYAGYQVSSAASSEAALLVCAECDVVVMDLVPDADLLLAGLPSTKRVIVLTGREGASSLGRANRVLKKPCSSATLLGAIVTTLSNDVK